MKQPYGFWRLSPAFQGLLVILPLFFGFALVQAEDTESDFLAPLAEKSLEDAMRPMPESSLIDAEAYGNGPNETQESNLFTKKDTIFSVQDRELVITNDLNEEVATGVQLGKQVAFPMTVDITCRFAFESNGEVRFGSYCPNPDLVNGTSRSGEVAFSQKRVYDRASKVSEPIPFAPGETVSLRFVYDETGKGRVYSLDGTGLNLGIGGKESTAKQPGLQMVVRGGTVYIKSIRIYEGNP